MSYQPRPAAALCTGVVIPLPPPRDFQPEFLDRLGFPDVDGHDISAPESMAAGSHRKCSASRRPFPVETTFRRECK